MTVEMIFAVVKWLLKEHGAGTAALRLHCQTALCLLDQVRQQWQAVGKTGLRRGEMGCGDSRRGGSGAHDMYSSAECRKCPIGTAMSEWKVG